MASTANESVSEGRVEVIQFTVGGTQYALPVEEGNSIIEPKDTTRVPRASDAVDGVMDYRGEVAVIIDLREVLGGNAESETQMKDRIVVLDDELDNQTVGLRAESIVGVVTFDADKLNEDVERVDDQGASDGHVRGVFTPTEEDGEVVEVIDVEKILSTVREESRLEIQQTK